MEQQMQITGLERSIGMKERASVEAQANLLASQQEYRELSATVRAHIQGRGKEVAEDAPSTSLIQLLQVL